MKTVAVVFLGSVLFMVAGYSSAQSNRDRVPVTPSGPEIRSPVRLFTAEAMADTNRVSEYIALDRYRPWGTFSLQIKVTGTGTVDRVAYEVSNNGVDFVQPVGAASVFTNFTATSGTAGNGIDLQGFQPVLAGYMRFRVYATNGASVVTLDLGMQ